MNSCAKKVLSNLLNGYPPNGIAPADCVPYETEFGILCQAYEAGGADAVRDALKGLEKVNPDLAKLANDPLVRLGIIDGDTLMRMEYPPIDFVVEPVLPEGTTLLAGPPKSGKSMIAMNIALALATGGCALGKREAEQSTDVLYLNYDGSERGMQNRLEIMMAGNEHACSLKRLHIVGRGFPTLKREDPSGLQAIRLIKENYPELSLVVIDTLKRFRGRTNAGKNLYEADVEDLSPLYAMADELRINILLLHHTRKSKAQDSIEEVSGSMGLTGSVDNVLLLKKERGSRRAQLDLMPREEEEQTFVLDFDPMTLTWVLQGRDHELGKTEARQRILDLLEEEGGPMGPTEIATHLQEPVVNIRRLVRKMVEAGTLVQPRKGAPYSLPTW